jgi:hypothetical protein
MSYRHRIELCTVQHEQLSKHPVDNLSIGYVSECLPTFMLVSAD